MEAERTGNARPPMSYIFVRFGNRQALGVASMNSFVKVSREFSAPFNPGNGQSAHRLDPDAAACVGTECGPDAESHASPGAAEGVGRLVSDGP